MLFPQRVHLRRYYRPVFVDIDGSEWQCTTQEINHDTRRMLLTLVPRNEDNERRSGG